MSWDWDKLKQQQQGRGGGIGGGAPPQMDEILDKFKKFKIDEDFVLFSKESQTKYKKNFEEVTKIIMTSIHDLLDEKYKKPEE